MHLPSNEPFAGIPLAAPPSAARTPAARRCPRCGTGFAADAVFCIHDGTALLSDRAAQTLTGTLVAGQFLVEARLGEGGMGAVYRAVQVRMARPCALKVLRRDVASDSSTVARFRREASNSSQLFHPNIAALYDFGETSDGLFYLAMELVEGETLTTLVAREGALAPLRAASIVRQVADALAVADEHGVVHRDLKPDNVLLVPRRDGSDLAKVVDFGIAKATRVEGQRITRTGVVIGTPAFMSPEQLAGESDLDGRSDQYALGLIAFELLTGARAFPARTFGEATRRMVAEPPKLAEHRPDVAWPPGLQAVIDRALALDRAQRWPTATAFGTAFAQTIQAWQAPGSVVPGFAAGLVATPAVMRQRLIFVGAVLLVLIALTVVLTLL